MGWLNLTAMIVMHSWCLVLHGSVNFLSTNIGLPYSSLFHYSSTKFTKKAVDRRIDNCYDLTIKLK